MGLSPRALGALLLYPVAYAGALARLKNAPGFEAGESLAVLLIFGVAFSVAAWLATRGIAPAGVPVRAPARELVAILVYLALFAWLILGLGLSALKLAVPEGRTRDVAELLLKLATMVALPAWLFTRLGYAWRELLGLELPGGKGFGRALLVIGALLLALQLVVGRGPQRIAALDEPAWLIAVFTPLALAWMTLEAGLTEEFLFRVLLQTRAAAWLRSEAAGIAAMALLFGLAHAPGYVLRGAHLMEGMSGAPDPLTAAAYSIVVVSPIGLMFGVLWARTRSLLLVVLLHGWTDLVPNLAPFVLTWTR